MEAMARNFAAADARAKLLSSLGTAKVETTVTGSEVKITSEGTMVVDELAYWKSPKGEVFVLLAARRLQSAPESKK